MNKLEEEYQCSEKLKNGIEHEHYFHARKFLEQFGLAKYDLPRELFKGYDEAKEGLTKAMEGNKMDQDYIDMAMDLTEARALEILDIAEKDHLADPISVKKQEENEVATPNSWRK